MSHTPSSPNVFEAIHISSPINAEAASQNHSQSSFFFTKRLESIQNFMHLLQDNPEDLSAITETELRWERNFFRNQLKAALYLNYSLIKLHCQSQQELKTVKSDIGTRTSEQKKVSQEIENRPNEWNCDLAENSQEASHVGTPLKKKLVKEAFEAEKKIIQAKYQLELEELRKTNEHRECMLKACKEENEYLRSQFIKMSEKNAVLHKVVKQAEQYKKSNQSEHKRQNMVIRQLQENEKKWKQEKRFNQLNCSPIARAGETFALQEGEISFNNQFFHEPFLEIKQLKSQLQDAEMQLEVMRKQLKQRSLEESEHNHVLSESRRYFLISLEKEYLEVKEALMERIEEIERYKKIVQNIQEITEFKVKRLTAENERLIGELAFRKADNQIEGEKSKSEDEYTANEKCANCLSLKKSNRHLVLQIEQTQSKYNFLRQKFDRTLNLELLQRKQWDAFLNDLNPDTNQ